mmetsp:Transcript_19785/g.48572  ORF Transcript_19785/g.48572 Transcript_19785/m.48572 type:complete len:104 (+) Transcript_19785:2-313(+)
MHGVGMGMGTHHAMGGSYAGGTMSMQSMGGSSFDGMNTPAEPEKEPEKKPEPEKPDLFSGFGDLGNFKSRKQSAASGGSGAPAGSLADLLGGGGGGGGGNPFF